MASINPYLNFDGKTEEAFNFYKSVFGGEFVIFSRFSEAPPMPGTSADDANRIMHVSLPISKGSILMGSDVPSSYPKPTDGNNFSISINTDSEDEATKIFKGLSAGGTVTMPLEKTFWNAYFGMLTDKFGIKWMVNYDYAKN